MEASFCFDDLDSKFFSGYFRQLLSALVAHSWRLAMCIWASGLKAVLGLLVIEDIAIVSI